MFPCYIILLQTLMSTVSTHYLQSRGVHVCSTFPEMFSSCTCESVYTFDVRCDVTFYCPQHEADKQKNKNVDESEPKKTMGWSKSAHVPTASSAPSMRAASPPCPDQFHHDSDTGMCLLLMKERIQGFTSARFKCKEKAKGGRLAVLDTPKKLAAAKSYLHTIGGMTPVYVGGVRVGNIYRWTDTRKREIRQGWCPGEPSSGGLSFCVTVTLRNEKGLCLHDRVCEFNTLFLCENENFDESEPKKTMGWSKSAHVPTGLLALSSPASSAPSMRAASPPWPGQFHHDSDTGMCLLLMKERVKGFPRARFKCKEKAKGGRLAVLDTPKKLAAAKSYLHTIGMTPVYVGGRRVGNIYRWTDKLKREIRQGWCPGEPSSGGLSFCVTVTLRNEKGLCLHDRVCDFNTLLLCEAHFEPGRKDKRIDAAKVMLATNALTTSESSPRDHVTRSALCPDFYHHDTGTGLCLLLVKAPVWYYTAKSVCKMKAKGGRLAVLDTTKKIEAAKAYLISKGHKNSVYVGGQRKQNVYKWQDVWGTTIKHGWCPGQPAGTGDCVSLSGRQGFCLVVVKYASHLSQLCEVELKHQG